MRRMTLLIILLPVVAQASGTLMIQPQPDSSVRFMPQGPTGSGGEDVLSFQQPASGRMTVTVSPSGISRCESGDIMLENLRVSFTNLLDNSKVLCGMPVTFEASGRNRDVPLKVAASPLSRPAPMAPGNLKQALLAAGSVSAVAEGGESQQYPLYLDLSVMQQPMEALTASFSRPALYLGSVGEMNDAIADVQLRISKNGQASDEAIGYTLSFESTQQLNNQYRMRSPASERMVPYQILIGGREVLPDSARRGTIPAGIGTSDVVDIQFKLSGKQTRGMMAGVSLQDTVTAVITPDS